MDHEMVGQINELGELFIFRWGILEPQYCSLRSRAGSMCLCNHHCPMFDDKELVHQHTVELNCSPNYTQIRIIHDARECSPQYQEFKAHFNKALEVKEEEENGE